jgi:hypothetical protein
VIELPAKASLQMGEIGGMTVLALKPGDWTVMVRSEATAEPRAASSPLDRL